MNPLLDNLADAIVDGGSVDWGTAESTSDDGARRLIAQLRLLSTVADIHRERQPRQWGHLHLLERIGRGSFGLVYRAHDTRLDREVALKLLPADPASSDRASSFIREGRLLAKVRHPNVVTIHGAEEIRGQVGLWMEFVRGRTLEELLNERARFSAEEATAIGVELCHALAAVHGAGLLHRDVKAQNVMRADDGRIVLMDFGTGREFGDTAGSDLTGTPLYLAPEVLRGEPATRQSDIYSLGVLLYHLLTGTYPVRGSSLSDVRRAHERQTRVELAVARPDLPRRLMRAIDRAIDPQPERRYAGAGALGADLFRARTRPPRRLFTIAAAAAVTILIGGAWWYAGTDRAAPPRALAAHERPVIAVLPFTNDDSDPGSDLFVDGLTHEIIRSLAAIDGLDVLSATSSFALKSKPRDVTSIGAQLSANLLLDGSVLRSGQRLRVHASLVLVSGNVPVWSDKFDRTLDDVFAIQDEISRAIVNALRLKLGRGQRRYDTNPQVYDRYLRARALVQRRGPGGEESLALFREVVAADPTFAPAYAGIASAIAKQSLVYPNVDPTNITPEAANALIRPAAMKALELDPLLAEAHAAMGLVHSTDLDWEQSERSFRRALSLDPGQSQVYADFVFGALWPQGRIRDAIDTLDRALELDPLSPFLWRLQGRMKLLSGAYADAHAAFDRTLELDPGFELGFLREETMVLSGRVSEAIPLMETRGPGIQGVLGYAYAVSGRHAEAEALAARNVDFPQRQVMIFGGLRDADRAFDALDRLAAINVRRALTYTTMRELDFVKDDPRMAAFRRRFGVR